MAVNWQEIIATVGGQGMFLAVAAWLIRALFTNKWARDAEEFKTRLKAQADIEIERLKSSLQMTAVEHQVRFSKLHERRAEVIAELYKRLVDVFWIGQQFVLAGASPAERGQREEYNNTIGSIRDFTLFVDSHQIYLPERICALLLKFLDELKRAVIPVGVYGATIFQNEEAHKQRNDAVMKAFEAFEKEIPTARKALETEFRSILGEPSNMLNDKAPGGGPSSAA
jgi:hypothetical protein